MRLHKTAPRPGGPGDQPAGVHPVDEVLPPHRLAVLGLQRLFIMYAGAVAVPLIVVSLSAGLILAVAPSFYERFPSDFQVIFGSSITSTVIVVFVLNLVFNHWTWSRPREDDAIDEALAYGAVAVDVADGGVKRRGADGQQTG